MTRNDAPHSPPSCTWLWCSKYEYLVWCLTERETERKSSLVTQIISMCSLLILLLLKTLRSVVHGPPPPPPFPSFTRRNFAAFSFFTVILPPLSSGKDHGIDTFLFTVPVHQQPLLLLLLLLLFLLLAPEEVLSSLWIHVVHGPPLPLPLPPAPHTRRPP